MKKIGVVIPYFGPLPATINACLSTMAYNKTVDFIFFTDQNRPAYAAENVKWYRIAFEQLKQLALQATGVKYPSNSPYKLCDYKPAYGDIFSEYVAEYDFWGWCDIDLVFGDIRAFITPQILEEYDVINKLGHFVLVKNTEKMRKMYQAPLSGGGAVYRQVFKCKSNFSFDEGNTGGYAFPNICYDNGVKIYYAPHYLDVSMDTFAFQKSRGLQKISRVRYINGKLFAEHIDGLQEEVLYAHFQGRNMLNQLGEKNYSEFYIHPNVISDSFGYAKDEDQEAQFLKKCRAKAIQSKKKRLFRAWELLLCGKIFSPRWRKIAIGRSE